MSFLPDFSEWLLLQDVQNILLSTASSESLEEPSSLVCRIGNKGSDIEGLFLTQLDIKEASPQLYFTSVPEKLLQGMMGVFTDFNMFLLMAARKASSNSTLDSFTAMYMKMPRAFPSCLACFIRFFGTFLGTFSSQEEGILKRKADNKWEENQTKMN